MRWMCVILFATSIAFSIITISSIYNNDWVGSRLLVGYLHLFVFLMNIVTFAIFGNVWRKHEYISKG